MGKRGGDCEKARYPLFHNGHVGGGALNENWRYTMKNSKMIWLCSTAVAALTIGSPALAQSSVAFTGDYPADAALLNAHDS